MIVSIADSMIKKRMRLPVLLLLGLLLGSAPWLFAQTTIIPVANLPYPMELNDIWGYVDSTGREYALVGTEDGVSIVDLGNPAQPTELHFIPGANSVWRDLKTFQHYAYVSNESSGGTLIIDLSGLPGNITWKDTLLGGISRSHNLWVDNDQLYIIGGNFGKGGMMRFDLGPDPWHPVQVGLYDDFYVHDAYVRNDTAYAAEITAGQMTILDWTDPANPIPLSSTTYPDAFTHNTWLNDAGDVVFTTDEIGNGFINAWDVSDPNNPVFLDGLRSSLSTGAVIPHNVHVHNDYLVTSYYRDGVQIVDAARPHNLVELAHYDTSPFEDYGFNGAWGAYPYLSSGLLLVTDIEFGLFVLQPDYQRACYLEGNVYDELLGFPIANADIQLLGIDSRTDASRTDGRYAIGTPVSGTYLAVFSKFGYFSDTIQVTLSQGQVTNLDVDMLPEARVPLRISVLDAVTQQPIGGAQVFLEASSKRAAFDYQTISTGLVQDPIFTVNEYALEVGKWGYLTYADTLLIDSTNYDLTVYLQPGYADDFALDLGWTVEGNAVRGSWIRSEPLGTYRENGDIYNPEYDLPDDIGELCYVTGNSDTLPFGDDVDLGYTQLISPPMDLSTYNEPVIQYHWWFLNWSLLDGGRPANDFLEVSITNGIDTLALKRYEGPFDTTWTHETGFFFLKYFRDLSQPFRVIFYTQDFESGNQDAVEAAIDGFRVVEGAVTGLQDPTSRAQVRVESLGGSLLRLHWQDLPPGSRVWLYDQQGRQLWTETLRQAAGSQSLALPVSAGWYWVQWHSPQGGSYSRPWRMQP